MCVGPGPYSRSFQTGNYAELDQQIVEVHSSHEQFFKYIREESQRQSDPKRLQILDGLYKQFAMFKLIYSQAKQRAGETEAAIKLAQEAFDYCQKLSRTS